MMRRIGQLALSTFIGLSAALAAQQTAAPPSGTPDTTTQPVQRRQADPNQQVRRLAKRLNLTPDQQSQMLPILSDRDAQIQNLTADNSLSRKDRHSKLRDIRVDSDTKIRALLSDDQKRTYDQLEAQMREHAKRHRSGQGKTDSANSLL